MTRSARHVVTRARTVREALPVLAGAVAPTSSPPSAQVKLSIVDSHRIDCPAVVDAVVGTTVDSRVVG
jgi:hypothetical protein